MTDAGPQGPYAPAPPAPWALQQPVQQVQQIPHLNWSHFKPEFSGCRCTPAQNKQLDEHTSISGRCKKFKDFA